MLKPRDRFGRLALMGMIAFVPAQNAWPVQAAQPPGATSSEESARENAPAPADSDQVEVNWQSVMLGGERIGYVRARLVPADAQGRIHTDTKTKMTFQRFGQELSITVSLATTETTDGRLLGYQYAMEMPASTTQVVGEVNGEKLTITSTIAGKTSKRTIPYDSSVKSPAYQDRLLQKTDLGPGESLSFKAFVPQLTQATTITVAAKDWETVTLPDGTRKKLLKMTITQSALPNLPMTAYVNKAGEMVLSEMELLGQTMKLVSVPRAEALREIVSVELDLAVTSLIPVTPIENPHETTRLVYKIHIPGENAAALFVDDGTQDVESIDRETVRVTVAARPIAESASAGQAAEKFTQPSQMVQSDSPAVKAHLAKATDPSQSDAEAARTLEAYVHDVIEEKNFTTAFASAATVAKELEGDCSEHAVLLAALLRARGIPSRLAAGLVYIPGRAKMGGHMWTEARLGGEWIPLDATLGRGGIGGGHIKIGTTSLGNKAPLPVACFSPLLSLGEGTTIEIVGVER